MPELVVSLRSVSLSLGEQTILSQVNFDIEQGEFVYLIGKTGSGKTTLLRLLYADLQPDEGSAIVAGFQISKIKPANIPFLRRKLGVVFQQYELLKDRSIEANLEFVLQALGSPKKSSNLERVHAALAEVGLAEAAKKFPHQLSGGEQQRVAIARALLSEPVLLIADEPTGNLDPAVAQEIHDLFIKINASGTAVLLATHNHNFLKRHPARVLFCSDKTIKGIDRDELIARLG